MTSGNRVLLDTNAIIALLRGNDRLLELSITAEWIGISVISHIEFLSFGGLSSDDETLFRTFASRVNVVGLTPDQPELFTRVIEVRRKFRRKLPDAIIAATAIHHDASLVTADADFSKIEGLAVLAF